MSPAPSVWFDVTLPRLSRTTMSGMVVMFSARMEIEPRDEVKPCDSLRESALVSSHSKIEQGPQIRLTEHRKEKEWPTASESRPTTF